MSKMNNMLEKFAQALALIGANVQGANYVAKNSK